MSMSTSIVKLTKNGIAGAVAFGTISSRFSGATTTTRERPKSMRYVLPTGLAAESASEA